MLRLACSAWPTRRLSNGSLKRPHHCASAVGAAVALTGAADHAAGISTATGLVGRALSSTPGQSQQQPADHGGGVEPGCKALAGVSPKVARVKVSIRHHESAGVGNGLSWDLLSTVKWDGVTFAT